VRSDWLHVAIVMAAGVIVGVSAYLIVALLVLLNSVVPLWMLGVLILAGWLVAFLYDYLGPNVPIE